MDEGFDPTQFGAVAVEQPPPFDPTQHGAIPVQQPEEPSILQKTGRAVVDTLKGFLPQSVSDVALAPINMIPGFGQAVKPLENIAFGRPISEGVSPLQGIPVVQRIPQIIQAEKTPAGSQERFTTGAGVVADLAMLAGFKSALHPELAEVAGIAKPEVAPETVTPTPTEPVATDTAVATPIVPEATQPVVAPEVAPSVPAAESVVTAPLSPETASLGKVEPVAPDLPTGTGEVEPAIHLADWRQGGFKELPAVYIRFGELPKGASGKFLEGKQVGQEAGVSVVKAWKDPETGKYVVPRIGTEDTEDISGINRKAYLVEGKSIKELGSDEEPLLQSGTGKIIKEISHDDIVSAEDPNLTYSGKELQEHETPDWTKSSPVSEAPVSTTAPLSTETEGGIENATQKGQQQESSITEHPGVPQGSDLPAHGEEVRQGQGERAGGSGSNEPAAQEQVAPPTEPTSGVNAAAMEQRPIETPEVGQGIGQEETRAAGHEWLDKGGDINKVMADFSRTGKVNEWDVGKGAAYLERLQSVTDKTSDALRSNPNDPLLQQQYGQALSREQTFSDAFKPMATTASNTLKGFQGKTTLTDDMADSFSGLNRKFREFQGKEMTEQEVVKADRLAKQNAKAKSDYSNANQNLYKKADETYKAVKGPSHVPTIQELAKALTGALEEVC